MGYTAGRQSSTWVRAVLCLIVTALFLTLPAARGQIATSTLSGTITDQTGAAVPGANVTAINNETGLTTKTASDQSGNYTFPSLSPGNYNISVEKPGFKSALMTGIKLLVAKPASIDIHLEVGELST